MIELGEVVWIGRIAVAAVSERAVQMFPSGTSISGFGSKQPAAVLVRQSETTITYDMNGSRLALAEFDQQFPGQRLHFESQLGTTPKL